MHGLKPIDTVRDLKLYLDTCPETYKVYLVPEDGESFRIGGLIEVKPEKGKSDPGEVWLLIDEFGDQGEENLETECGTIVLDGSHLIQGPPPTLEEKKDVVKIRGKLKSA